MNNKKMGTDFATIDELLGHASSELDGTKKSTQRAAARLAAWCEYSSSGDWTNFSKRIKLESLTYEEILNKLSICDAPLQNPSAYLQYRKLLVSDKTVFEAIDLFANGEVNKDFLWDLTFKCWNELSKKAKLTISNKLSDSAAIDLQKLLFTRLLELAQYFLDAQMEGAYNKDFTNDIGIINGKELSPTLIRLILIIISQWVDVTNEFLLRLGKDHAAVIDKFFSGRRMGLIERIECSASDLHNGGRSVYLLYFNSNDAFIYKPKELKLDEQLHQLVTDLNSFSVSMDLKVPNVISMKCYGWSEYIKHLPCETEDAMRNFYKRSGCLIALFHILVATDMHEENIIAAGEFPIPIDLEMLLQPYDADGRDVVPYRNSYEMAIKVIEDSVAMIGLLPSYKRAPKKRVIMSGGLAIQEKPLSSSSLNENPSIKINSFKVSNSPYYGETVGNPKNYVNEIVLGFKEYSRFLIQIKNLKGVDYIYSRFNGLKVRRVYRPTRFYELLLTRLKKNVFLNDVAAWSAEADFVSRFIDWDSDSNSKLYVYKSERKALLELNIPFFSVGVDTNLVFTDNKCVGEFYGVPGLRRGYERLTKLDELEITRQAEIIQLSFGSELNDLIIHDNNNDEKSINESDLIEKKLSNFLQESENIARFIKSLAIETDQSASWIGLEWLGDSRIAQLLPLRSDLYSGSLGIAIFLAAWGKKNKNNDFIELSLKAAAYASHQLQSNNRERLANNLGLGGSVGIGSMVYGLAVLSEITSKSNLLDDALVGSRLITPKIILSDRNFDVFDGVAGAILSLLSLHKRINEPELLQRAIQCGQHLINHFSIGNLDDFNRRGGVLLNGMSHGAAGIAYALTWLANSSGREDFLTLADKFINIENSTYCKINHNWPDFRQGMFADNKWSCQWCHGAAGIGLARIASVRMTSQLSKAMLNDIERSIESITHFETTLSDTLCCGSIGNIELLFEASKQLGIPHHKNEAIDMLYSVLINKKNTGSYKWDYGPTKFNIGLFKGLSGVGYTMLRMAGEDLPNLLIWE